MQLKKVKSFVRSCDSENFMFAGGLIVSALIPKFTSQFLSDFFHLVIFPLVEILCILKILARHHWCCDQQSAKVSRMRVLNNVPDSFPVINKFYLLKCCKIFCHFNWYCMLLNCTLVFVGNKLVPLMLIGFDCNVPSV